MALILSHGAGAESGKQPCFEVNIFLKDTMAAPLTMLIIDVLIDFIYCEPRHQDGVCDIPRLESTYLVFDFLHGRNTSIGRLGIYDIERSGCDLAVVDADQTIERIGLRHFSFAPRYFKQLDSHPRRSYV